MTDHQIRDALADGGQFTAAEPTLSVWVVRMKYENVTDGQMLGVYDTLDTVKAAYIRDWSKVGDRHWTAPSNGGLLTATEFDVTHPVSESMLF